MKSAEFDVVTRAFGFADSFIAECLLRRGRIVCRLTGDPGRERLIDGGPGRETLALRQWEDLDAQGLRYRTTCVEGGKVPYGPLFTARASVCEHEGSKRGLQ